MILIVDYELFISWNVICCAVLGASLEWRGRYWRSEFVGVERGSICCCGCGGIYEVLILFSVMAVEAATALFEYACSKIPKNTDYQIALFNCYARQYLYVKQQQVDYLKQYPSLR